ncbi:uncharacterized protein [Musca autumnalis]|uniref:uncharacterized protein n=1 Tax=Musca autumnalis TaxID=221902 RepID=UPI003CED7A19
MEYPKQRYIPPAGGGGSDNRTLNMCRFCGCEDKENVDIFSIKKTPSSSNEKPGVLDDLLSKISTVYPFVIYKNDPLPQQICPKCIANVYALYRDIQDVLRHQKKLLNMLRNDEPRHEYFRILNEIENSSRSTKLYIKASYNVDINQNTPIKLLTFPSTEDLISEELPTLGYNDKVPKPPHNEKLVQNIQTKLEQNGCTIKRIRVSQTETRSVSPNESLLDATDDTDEVSCPYCELKFPSAKLLAEHQVEHLNISSNKLFEKRLLPKHLRRGRLICVNNEKNIRCLNCWQVFKDNRSILQHWSNSDCYFYCFICGKEFPHSPKVLREHMPSVHGISFRSVMKQFYINRTIPSTKLASFSQPSLTWKLPHQTMSSMSHHPPMHVLAPPRKKKRFYYKDRKSSTKNPDGTFSCNICHKVFSNYRSSNSHMRIHNLPELFARKDIAKDDSELLLPDLPQSSNSIKKHTPPPVPIAFRTAPVAGIAKHIIHKPNDFISNNTSPAWGRPVERRPESLKYSNDDDSELLFPTLNEDLESMQATVKSEPIDDINSSGEFTNQWKCFICHDVFATSKEYNMHAMFVHNISD